MVNPTVIIHNYSVPSSNIYFLSQILTGTNDNGNDSSQYKRKQMAGATNVF